MKGTLRPRAAAAGERKRVALVASHPIQYQAPWFQALAVCPALDVEVLFCQRATPQDQAQAGFGVAFDWDTPLLEGYPYRFLRNTAVNPSVHGFRGLDTPEIRDIIAGNRYDAVIVSGWHYKSAWQTIRACWATRTPVLVRGDSHLHARRPRAQALLKALPYRWFIPRFDACLAAGKWSREYFLRYGARRDRVFIVPHAIDERRFSEEYARLQLDRRALRQQWGLEDDATVFLFAGKFIEVKRPLDFVRAIDAAARQGVRVTGWMAGDGPLRPACERLVEETGAPVRFTGFVNQSQMVSCYAAADAVVLTSATETWGMVVSEAMYCERPAIISDQVGCGPDLIVPGETGWVYPAGDVEGLARVLVEGASDPARLSAMGRKARRQVAHYSIAAAVEGVLDALAAISNN